MTRSILFFVIFLFAGSCKKHTSDTAIVLKPFPQHPTYTTGTISPTNYTINELDNQTKEFYSLWKARYIVAGCKSDQYYVYSNLEHQGSTGGVDQTITVSEAHGYGMLITAYMAGYDAHAKKIFDGLYNFYKSHPSVNNSGLMAWNQIIGCINNPGGGNDSATDGDLDIAYALLLAHYQWGSDGKINYLSEAKNIINAIMQSEINQNKFTVLLGDWSDQSSGSYNDTRTSDFAISHFKAFYQNTNDARWNQVSTGCYNLCQNIYQNYSPTTGLLPDFVQYKNNSYVPATPNYLESDYDGDYYYNACRTPWRLSVDYLLTGDNRVVNQLHTLNQWIQTKAGGDPNNIVPGYLLSGEEINSAVGDYSLAFVAPLAVSAMTDPSQQIWLNSLTTKVVTTSINDEDYFGNSIKMVNMIILSGNYWMPN